MGGMTTAGCRDCMGLGQTLMTDPGEYIASSQRATIERLEAENEKLKDLIEQITGSPADEVLSWPKGGE